MKMNIAEKLIKEFDIELSQYFNPESWEYWKSKYEKQLNSIHHDEPWLTLITLYSIFGNQADRNNRNRIKAINQIISNSRPGIKLFLSSVDEIIVEKQLSEIMDYRSHLKKKLKEENFHLYPDRKKIISDKLKKKASFEGNTNLDVLIKCQNNESRKCIFIEAKFLSDISYQITYNPVRDQIIRNIDAGIDFIKEEKIDYNDYYFFLLTPKIFRPDHFGQSKKSVIHEFNSSKSRLYCYKMLDYVDYRNLKQNLPHRTNLSDKDWKQLSNNIGWMTFEDFFTCSRKYKTVEAENKELIHDFFEERSLTE